MDMNTWLAPIAAESPCGEDLSFSEDFDRLREARREDDPTLSQGEWVSPLKRADWPAVMQSCDQLLVWRSKDLRLAGWWTEAAWHLHGFDGLADGLERYAALVQTHWPSVHPQCLEDGMEPRLGSLDWLQHQVQQALRRIPLLQEGEQSLDRNGLEAARRSLDANGSGSEEWARRVRRSDPAALGQVRRAVNRLPSALQMLEQAVDARLGAEGPGFAATRDAVAATVALVERLARERGLEPAPPAEGTDPSEVALPHAGDPGTPQSPTGAVRTRAQALWQLRSVAAFFRETEPHSPVAYLVDRAARWGEMPLHEWLRTVMKDGAGLSQLEELLGVSGDDRVA
jgi:type VI secretion system protein ImpA